VGGWVGGWILLLFATVHQIIRSTEEKNDASRERRETETQRERGSETARNIIPAFAALISPFLFLFFFLFFFDFTSVDWLDTFNI